MALDKLKSLFKNNSNLDHKPNNQELANKSLKPAKLSYEEWGFELGRHLNGNHLGLLQSLRRVKEDHKKMVRGNQTIQQRKKEPWITSRRTKKEEIDQKQEIISNIKDKRSTLDGKIETLEKDIINIKSNNTEDILPPDPLSKVTYVIGLLILSALTIYLFIFYSSASYSAFFKVFTLNTIGVADTIFDAQALSKASQDGITELILIISMPFLFLGLGFLIHKFQEQKGIMKFLKIGFLIIITFVFDAILAYEITEKIYNIKADNSFQDLPEYTFEMAFSSVRFWLIIFAGFVAYLIWGLVFDFTFESYDKLNVLKQKIKAKNSEIDIHKKQLAVNGDEINKLHEEINVLKLSCAELTGKIDGDVIDTTEFNKLLQEFLGGWLHYMTANKKPKEDIDLAYQKANEFIEVNIIAIENVNLNA